VSTPTVRQDCILTLDSSGSTGTPKGVVWEHSTLATSVVTHGAHIGIKPSSRVLQFAAFVFDVSVSDIFASLTCGGAVCMPSEKDRLNNITSAIPSLRANWAHLASQQPVYTVTCLH